MPHNDDPFGPPDDWEEDDDWDWDEEEARGPSCNQCGPWCSEWGGDGLCMIAIRSMAEEYEREHPLATAAWWLRSFLATVLDKILPTKDTEEEIPF